jgi:hypothetical protein
MKIEIVGADDKVKGQINFPKKLEFLIPDFVKAIDNRPGLCCRTKDGFEHEWYLFHEKGQACNELTAKSKGSEIRCRMLF